MDTINIFTPELAEIRFHTTLQFPLPDYMKKDWKVRIDKKYQFIGEVDFEELCMYSKFQYGGLTESVKYHPCPIYYRENTYHFECLETEIGIREDGIIGGHLFEVFKKLIENREFKEYDDSYYIEYLYHNIKEHKLPNIETVGEKYNFEPKIELNHSLADS